MGSSNVPTALAIYDAFNRRDFDAMVAAVALECVWRDHPEGSTRTGRDGIRTYFGEAVRSFSDMQVTELRALDAGTSVVVLNVVVATHDGPLGSHRATGRRMILQAADVLHFGDEGDIVAGESYYDRLAMLSQLGLLPR